MSNLDLKYRPKKFSEMLGNQAVVELLLKLSCDGKLGARSLLFEGNKGCGKTSLARIVATAIVCTEIRDGEPCGVCESCLGVRQESATSFEEFDAATQGSVEHMRNIVSELDYGNLDGKPSMFILDEAQRLTKHAQDAILKSVEERRLLVILSTTEPHKIQGPLRSRLTEFQLIAPPTSELESYLKKICNLEKIAVSDVALKLIMESQENCPRTCFTTLELLSSLGPISEENVRQHFRIGVRDSLILALEKLSVDPKNSIEQISNILNSEGALWAKEQIMLAVTNAVRISVGIKFQFKIEGAKYSTCGPVWVSIAKSIGQIDKPNSADIETILFGAIPNLPVSSEVSGLMAWSSIPGRAKREADRMRASIQDVKEAVGPEVSVQSGLAGTNLLPAEAPDAPALSSKPMEVPSKPTEIPPEVKSPPLVPLQKLLTISKVESAPIEIDGIKFSSTEKLTSVDDKIEKGTRGAPSPNANKVEVSDIARDKSHTPLTPSEFARSFRSRMGQISKVGNDGCED